MTEKATSNLLNFVQADGKYDCVQTKFDVGVLRTDKEDT